MNKLKGTMLAGLTGAAFSLSAPASAIVIAGVAFEVGANLEVGQVYERTVAEVGDILTGFGRVTTINNDLDFCDGCELTFEFGGYRVESISATHVDFSGGFVNFYVHNAPNFSGFDQTTATDGDLFLATIGRTYQDTTTGRTGTLLGAGANLNTAQAAGTGLGYLDVVGGLAFDYFNTNTFSDFLGGLTDIQFNSSFSPLSCGSSTNLPLCGSADLHSVVHQVPEPASLGLLGAGLLATGLIGWRQRRQGLTG